VLYAFDILELDGSKTPSEDRRFCLCTNGGLHSHRNGIVVLSLVIAYRPHMGSYLFPPAMTPHLTPRQIRRALGWKVGEPRAT